MKKEYILPNGVTTTNENQYICDWQSLAQTIERGLDVTVLASNPGFQIGDKDGAVTSIPMWLVRKIIGITEERDEAQQEVCELVAESEEASTGFTCTAKQIAARRGWDCFNQITETGITETGITETDINEANINNQSFRERKLD